MANTEIRYSGFTSVPLAAFDDGLYAAMRILGIADGSQRASGVLGHFAFPTEAREFAIQYAIAGIACRQLPLPEWA